MAVITTYTALTIGYDKLEPPVFLVDDGPGCGCEARAPYVCFTEDRSLTVPGWHMERLPHIDGYTPPDILRHPVKMQRAAKILGGLSMSAETVLYHDANMRLRKPPHEVAAILMGDCDFGLLYHPWRTCAYDEIDECLKLNRGDPRALKRQKVHCRELGLPRKVGLWSCGLFAYRRTEETRRFLTSWWNQVRDFSERDQIGFAFTRWLYAMPINVVPESPWKSSLIEIRPHAKGPYARA